MITIECCIPEDKLKAIHLIQNIVFRDRLHCLWYKYLIQNWFWYLFVEGIHLNTYSKWCRSWFVLFISETFLFEFVVPIVKFCDNCSLCNATLMKLRNKTVAIKPLLVAGFFPPNKCINICDQHTPIHKLSNMPLHLEEKTTCQSNCSAYYMYKPYCGNLFCGIQGLAMILLS